MEVDVKNKWAFEVLYELGICHALEKPVIIFAQNKHDIPYDIIMKNIIFYQSMDDLSLQLSKELTKILVKE